MSQPTQIKFGLPNGDWCAIDNAAAPSFPTLAAGTHIGYDTVNGGAVAQSLNSFGDTGTALLDPVNDSVMFDPTCATFAGNPVAMTLPTFTTVSKVVDNAVTGIRVLFKNPA